MYGIGHTHDQYKCGYDVSNDVYSKSHSAHDSHNPEVCHEYS